MLAIQAILTTYEYSLLTDGRTTTQRSMIAGKAMCYQSLTRVEKILDCYRLTHNISERYGELR